MRPETLLYAIGEVDDAAVQDARDPKLKRPHRWRRWLVTAACLCLVVLGIWTARRFDYLDFLRTGCAASIGTVVDGDYYFMSATTACIATTRKQGSASRYSAPSGTTAIR